MKKQLASAAVVVSLMSTACSGPAATGKPPADASAQASSAVDASSREASREALHAALASLGEAVRQKGSAAALGDAATDDVVTLLGGQYALKGRDALRKALTEKPLERAGTLTLEPVRWDVSADGQLGYALGQGVRDDAGSENDPQRRYVRFILVWKHAPGVGWHIAAANFSPAKGPLAPPAGLAAPSAGATKPAAPAVVLAEAFAADSAFSAQSEREGMGPAFIAYAAEDAALPTGASGLFGRAAITQDYAPKTLDKAGLRWEPKLGGAAGSGDLAYTIGRGFFTAKSPDGKATDYPVKYLTVWQRQADGAWRFVTDDGSGNPGADGP